MHPIMFTDLDFADDVSLLSDTTEKGRELLLAVERKCKKIGLTLNAKKTKVMAFNIEDKAIATAGGMVLEVVEDFKYLGTWIASTEKDLKVRKALAWKALYGMRKEWNSEVISSWRQFVASAESVLLYGAETWSLTVQQKKALDGVYTRMLRMALDVTWGGGTTSQTGTSTAASCGSMIKSEREGWPGTASDTRNSWQAN